MYKKFLAFSIILFFYTLSYAEDITITTYYPSPYGIYNDLTVANNLRLETDPTNPAADGPQIEWRTSNVAADRHWNIDQYGTRLRFFTEENFNDVNGAERMTILEAGNVGIGTTTPDDALTVNGEFRLYRDGTAPAFNTGMRIGLNPNNGIVNLTVKDRTNALWQSLFMEAQEMGFWTGGRSGGSAPPETPALFLNSNNNVGIGTTSPTTKLEIASDNTAVGNLGFGSLGRDMWFDGGTDSNYVFYNTGASTGRTTFAWKDTSTDPDTDHDRVSFLNNGNVGIGTDAPRAKLHVVGNGEGIWLDRTSGPVPLRFLQNNTRIWTIEGSDVSPYSLLFRAVADDFIDFTEPLTLYRNGNVGIGPNNSIQNTLDDDWTPTLRHGEGTPMDPFHDISFQWGSDSSFGIMVDGNYVLRLPTAGFPTSLKTFVINHPLDNSKYLVHATLEGPEAGVYYRGTTKLKEGMAEIKLPDYFETLTALEGRSVQLTAIDGFDRLSVKKVNGQQIYLAKFTVYSDNPHSEQEFNWEVKAVRKDVPPLIVEPDKDKITVLGEGPYTYYKERIE